MLLNSEDPEFSITEFLLCGLFIAGALCHFIYAGYALFNDENFLSVEAAGVALMLLGGCIDPKKYIVDCVTYPFTFVERAGRDTPITLMAAGLGFAMWLTGWVGHRWL